MADIKVTYETLFDLLRREKSKNEIQEMDPTFYVEVVMYLKSKQDILNTDSSTVSRAEQEKIRIQLKNIKRILRELYEIREKKILNLAMNKVRTGSSLIDTSMLLNEERGLDEESVMILEKYKKGILSRLTNYDLPNVKSEHFIPSAQTHSINEQEESEDYETEEKQIETPVLVQEKKEEPELNAEITKVKFLSNLPRFMGLDKKVYGPFEKGTTDELPSSVAELLSKKGRVEIV